MCYERCIAPPSPELEEKIIRSKQRLREGIALPGKTDKDVLDQKSAALILTRPPKTRAHTLISPTKQFSPIVGVRKALVLLVDFSDKTAAQTQQHYSDMLFSSGTYATGSMRDFYREASYGRLDVVGEVSGTGGPTAGWYRAPQTKAYYTNDDYGFGSYPRNAQKLVEDVIDLAAPHVNFAEYDNDGDGIVDALVIIAAGSGGEATGNRSDIWSHKWSIAPKTYNGVQIRNYFMAPEDGRVGVMAHELGHLLMQWPDLYDTDYSSRGTGRWDLMAGGSWNNGGDTPAHPTAWCKLQAGWITPKVIFNDAQSVNIQPYHSSADVYKLPIGDVNSKEYFLVTNRQQQGFDRYLPGSGCIIEHVDDNQANNTDENHYLVDIEQADGNRDLNTNANSGDTGDAFPSGANNVFNDTTTPNSKAYDGSNSSIDVSAIRLTGNTINATISVGTVSTQVWLANKIIDRTYTSYHTQNAWVHIKNTGWRKIKSDHPDGVTHLLIMACEAQANNVPVTVYVDDSTIYRMYMV
ncbi:immune inhibitor A [Nitrosomonas marina]|uniref:Immune inhibitor A n=1 Tax=Nitrosomonas marina TaxID=917 RepID=A0A1I0CF84_9PROT|nr:M6 family metalloprotease domain-containing protein [Nitrosomonas marina]SET18257.1 immune inhibitor A [Nitrosomonas marina]